MVNENMDMLLDLGHDQSKTWKRICQVMAYGLGIKSKSLLPFARGTWRRRRREE